MKEFYTNVSKVGSWIFYTGYESDGEKVLRKEKYSPSLYVKTKQRDAQYRTIHGENLERVDFETIADANKFVKNNEGSNVDVYGNTNYVFQYIVDKFPNEISDIDSSFVNVCNFDLEIDSSNGFPHPDRADSPVISGVFYFSRSDEYVVLGLKDSYEPPSDEGMNVRFIHCNDEIALLSQIMNLLQIHSPDILTGWNIRLFDIPYLIHRIDRVFGEGHSKKLSPWSRIHQKSIYIKGKENIAYDILGISQLDYLDVFKKFSQNTYGQLESYRLDNVGHVVLGKNKLDYSEYSNLHQLYENDYQKFIDYNLQDVQLVKQIDEQVRYIDIAMMIAFKTGVNFSDTLATVNAWDTYIYRELLKRNIVVPPNEYNKKRESFEGAYVKNPVPGMYDWVVSFDLASLYPNIIVQYNISPETIVQGEYQRLPNGVDSILNGEVQNENKNKYSMTANGIYFRKDKQGIIAELMEKVYNERFIIQDQQMELEKKLEEVGNENKEERESLKRQIDIAENAQISVKLFLNSGYGCLGSPYFRFFDVRIAEAITMTGQLSTRWAEKSVNEYLMRHWRDENDRIITCDTDSIYINTKGFIDEFNPRDEVAFLDKVCQKAIDPVIRKGYNDLFDVMGAYKNRMNMKREKICSKGVFLGKKRYFLNVIDNKGVRYKEPKVSITGVEAVKSSTPAIIREKLKDSFRIILNSTKDEIQQFMDKTEEFFMSCTPEDIAFPRGVNGIEEYMDKDTIYKKRTPINSRASILYNKCIDELDLSKKYPKIAPGEKMRYVYLKLPNHLKEDVIGFIDVLPPEFNLHKYVDYEKQFEKTFLAVIMPIFDKIGWKINQGPTLEDFFI